MSEEHARAKSATTIRYYRLLVCAELFSDKMQQYAESQSDTKKRRQCLAMAASVAAFVKEIA